MPLETATYIASLVVTNPDGSDQKNTSDDHLRLIKACLKRSWPLIDGAVSLSHTQLMRLNDVSASVQLQINTLRDGSATAYNALYANSASFAANTNNALSLGGHAAAAYPRLAANNTFTTRQTIAIAGEALRIAGGNDDYISFYNAAQSALLAYIQLAADTRLIISNSFNGPIDLHCTTIRFNGTSTVWHAGNDGEDSGLDADLLEGRHGSEGANGSTAALRTAAGYIYATRFNTEGLTTENPTVASVFVNSGDGFIRNATPAYLGSLMQARNVTGKSGTAKTLSASSPSGGSDGDIWYQL